MSANEIIQRTVLLIEDEPLITLLYQQILEDSEFLLTDPMTCSPPVLRYLEDNSPDLAIVDLYLEDGPCLQVIETLRELGIPLLIVSGHGDAVTLAEREEFPILTKPFTDGALVKALRAL